MKNKKSGWKIWMFLVALLIIMLAINFTGSYFGLTHLNWHLFLHIGIIIFSFFILVNSLKLNEKATRYIFIGSMIWIITNCILFLGHVFEEYYWLETNVFTFSGMIVGCFVLMKGFKEGVKNG